MKGEDLRSLGNEAALLAETWQQRANELLTSEEKGIQEQMKRLLSRPMNRVVLTRMIDQSFRSRDRARVSDQVNSILHRYGIPDFFSAFDKLLIQMFMEVGHHFPSLAIPKMIEKMRQSSSRAVIPGEAATLHEHLRRRKKQGVRMNINHLGEAVLGEKEARRRLLSYQEDLENPEIECISVKISTIYSQINPLAFDYTVKILKERLNELYRTAAEHVFVRANGEKVPKFVNLDMEEYRDQAITLAAFIQTLDQECFWDHGAGIALQAYLPDAFHLQKTLTAWARERVARGGEPVRLRIVKGANLEMEKVESAIRNWPLAPYNQKLRVDANYRRMVEFGMRPDNISAVHLGIASHNLFELAFADRLAAERKVSEHFHFEMLEGMADHVRRAIREVSGDVLLYAPVAGKEEFINAIAYLIRRLDENTAPENFLRYASDLHTDSPEWRHLKENFLMSFSLMDELDDSPHRTQDRLRESFPDGMGTFHENEFTNEPDTDWSLSANRLWAESIRDKWRGRIDGNAIDIPIVVGGREIFQGRPLREVFDLNRIDPTTNRLRVIGRYAVAGQEDMEEAIRVAGKDPDGWRTKSHDERHEILSRVAMELRRARSDLVGSAAANTGKVFLEADAEVSEAIDFAEYYPFSVTAFERRRQIQCRGKGVALVISPWNFPIAIPCGGILSALAAGNTVLFKPASAAVLVARELCRCIWKAGVSRNTLQFIPCSGKEAARLVQNPHVDFAIFTGSTQTALDILEKRPELQLFAETGGKNATIVTAMSDRDQAIKNVVYSAFGNSGQKCSATSLLILEKEVYEDDHFKSQLVDAAQSFQTGSVWSFENRMGPLIAPPKDPLLRAMTTLEEEESWALKPQNILNNPHMWTPGIKYGVQPGSFTHMTEFFGPVLGVMAADHLDHAIDMANQTGYGLTAALESLDPREQEHWKERIKAGNLYINRGTTGAVVLRQPFGGMGKSSIGQGLKAGGPNYVTQFMEFEETGYPVVEDLKHGRHLLHLARQWQQELSWGRHPAVKTDLKKTVRAIRSYLYHYERTFSVEHDYFHLRGQDNILRYRTIDRVLVRIHPDDTLFDILARIAAAKISGCRMMVSMPPDIQSRAVDFLRGMEGQRIFQRTGLTIQTDDDLIKLLPKIDRIRYAAPGRVPQTVYEAAAKCGSHICASPVLMEGRIELLRYFREQSVCNTYHRYGNLGERGLAEDWS